jgi:ABC-type nitrate/sulfonate/bicarbonate transport system ATPase subunit
MRPAGAGALLDVHIEQKTLTTSAGDRLEVLRNVRFAICMGEVAVFCGPSGCGKTTMLRIIAGLDSHFTGRVVRPPDATIGLVFQEPRLLPWRSVEDNVRFVAPDLSAARLSALFEVLQLDKHRKQDPGELSLGLARRVAIARAFAIDPDILILDEPLVSLDASLSAHIRDELAALVERRPVTTVLVTHSLDEAVRLGDRIFLLSARPGQIVAEVPIAKPRSTRNERDLAAAQREIERLAETQRSQAARPPKR